MLKSAKRIFWILGIVVGLLVIFLPGYTKLQELRDRNISLRTKIKDLNVHNAILNEELKRIKNDSVYQERIIREKLGVVRRGEILLKIIPEKKD